MLTNKHLWKYYKKYVLFFIIGLITLIAVDYIQLFVPEFLGDIIDLVNEGNYDISGYIWKMLAVALAIAVGRVIWRLAVFYAARKIESSIRHDMFLKAEKLSQSYFHVNSVGTVMDWFTNDLDTVEEYLGWGFIMIVDAIFLSLFVIVKIVLLDIVQLHDGILTLMTFAPIVLIIVWGAMVEKIMSLKWENRQKEFDRLYDYSRESFTGIRVIKAFVKERQEIKAFAKEAKRNQDKNIDFIKTSVIFDVIIEILIEVMVVAIIIAGAFKVHDGSYTVGNLVTFLGYSDSLIWPMIALGQIIAMRSRSKASMKRISAYLDAEIEIHDNEDSVELEECKGKIEFNNFNFKYPSENNNVLNNITLTINPGEKIGVIGKIGCGKTTLVNSLLHFYNVDRGSIKIDDIDLMDIKLKSLRDNIAYVMQDSYLFSDTIARNIAFADVEKDIEEIREAARFADVDSNISEFKEGYETVSGERGVTLSGGQKQRVAIARAYIKNSPILILDDSVAAVDLKTEETILKNIFEKRRNKTTILVASRVSTVIKMDKIIVLKDGEVEAFASPKELAKISPTFNKMVYLQALEKEVNGGVS